MKACTSYMDLACNVSPSAKTGKSACCWVAYCCQPHWMLPAAQNICCARRMSAFACRADSTFPEPPASNGEEVITPEEGNLQTPTNPIVPDENGFLAV